MRTYVLLLRAINLGPTRKVSMPRLRELLAETGFEDVRTHLQSGNVVLRGDGGAAAIAKRAGTAIEAEFGFEVPVVVRTAKQLETVVAADPLGDVVDDPKRYQVTFFERAPSAGTFDGIDADSFAPSTFVHDGAELYTWTPGGVHDDRLLRELGRATKANPGTARNWRTVTALLELASGS